MENNLGRAFQNWWTKTRKNPDLKYAAFVRPWAAEAFELGVKLGEERERQRRDTTPAERRA